jgi:hypothetical protein
MYADHHMYIDHHMYTDHHVYTDYHMYTDHHMYTHFGFTQNLTGARPTGTQLLRKSGDVCILGFFCWNWGRPRKSLFTVADARGCELKRGALEHKAGMLSAGSQCSVDLNVVVFYFWG